jgi:hypothetical protein
MCTRAYLDIYKYCCAQGGSAKVKVELTLLGGLLHY